MVLRLLAGTVAGAAVVAVGGLIAGVALLAAVELDDGRHDVFGTNQAQTHQRRPTRPA